MDQVCSTSNSLGEVEESSTREATFRSEAILCDSSPKATHLLVKGSRKLLEKRIQFGRLVCDDCPGAQFPNAIFQTPGLEMPGYEAVEQAPRRCL